MPRLARFQIAFEDELRYSRLVRAAYARWQSFRAARMCRSQSVADLLQAARQLYQCSRLTSNEALARRSEEQARVLLEPLRHEQIDWASLEPYHHKPKIESAVILKPWISPREKGAVMIPFEYQWLRLLRYAPIQKFSERYTLIIAPSWSPPQCLALGLLAHFYDGEIFTLISNEADRNIFPRISSRFLVVPRLASHWVNPALYQPVPHQQKDVDILMVANFGKYKRHHAFFRALREMPTGLRVLLIGRDDQQGGWKRLVAEAESYGVRKRMEILNHPPRAAVIDAFCRAKISLVMSRQEGSCIAVAESLFADTPVGLFEDALIGSRIFINNTTGRLLKQHGLAAQLMDFLAGAARYSPREWALANGLSCYDSTRVLNDTLKSRLLSCGQEWTSDLAVHHWNPHPELLLAADRQRMASEYAIIQERFGVRFERDEEASFHRWPESPAAEPLRD